MHSSHLTCPHCASTLNFGTEIAAGSPVECLICMARFVAKTKYVPACTVEPIPFVPPAAKKKLAKKPVPIGKPAVADAFSEKSVSTMPAPISEVEPAAPRPAPTRPRETPSFGTRGALIAVAAALLLLLTGGVGFAVWKIASAANTSSPDNGETPAYAAAILPTPHQPDEGNQEQPNPEPTPIKIGPPPIRQDAPPPHVASNDEEDEQQRKLLEAAKKLLIRKDPAKAASQGPELQSLIGANAGKQPPWGLDQQRIDLAIEKGVVYLKTSQKPDGTWGSGHTVGNAAIGGLTLLECNVPANDLLVQRAAAHVRANLVNLTSTYELSLAILFLDRLGDFRDRTLIQGMALRLLAGQLDGGGWSYNCSRLDPQEMYQLYTFLYANRRPNFFDPVGGNPNLLKGMGGMPGFSKPVGSKPADPNDPFKQLDDLLLNKAVAPPGPTNPATGVANPNVLQPLDDKKKFNALAATKPAKGKANPVRPEWLKKSLQGLPVVQNQGKGKGQFKNAKGGGDNSNTQFAILALWAARRHDVPTEQGILAAYNRFANSQHADGGWSYHVQGGSTPSMTCVGLLGEAMGHGTVPEVVVDPRNPNGVIIKPALQDSRIQAGLVRLSQNIGEPAVTDKNLPMENLYFLWSVERVAMLYDLKTINGKDWYGWGAQILVRNQQANGSWANSSYHGASPSLNTCFALLFLKRSNLVRDLTQNLRLQTAISD